MAKRPNGERVVVGFACPHLKGQIVTRVRAAYLEHSPTNPVIFCLERSKRHNLTKARTDATRAAEFRIRLQCRKPFAGECTSAVCCSTGLGAPLVDVEATR